MLVRRTESMVVLLSFRPATKGANLCPDHCEVESQARPAAFEEAAGVPVLWPPEDLGDLVGFFPSLVRKVVSMRLLFSGLGVLDLFLGWASEIGTVGGRYGENGCPFGIWGLLWDLSARLSELC